MALFNGSSPMAVAKTFAPHAKREHCFDLVQRCVGYQLFISEHRVGMLGDVIIILPARLTSEVKELRDAWLVLRIGKRPIACYPTDDWFEIVRSKLWQKCGQCCDIGVGGGVAAGQRLRHPLKSKHVGAVR